MKRYKYYLFDLDRTLWDFDANAERAIFYLLDKYGTATTNKPIDPEFFIVKYKQINAGLWVEYESGKITKTELRHRRFYDTLLLSGIDDPEFADTFDREYLERMSQETELMPHALEVLQTLHSEGALIAIITNGFSEVQAQKLNRSGLSPFVKALVTSEEIGVHKPSPKIFRIALERLTEQTDPLEEILQTRIEILQEIRKETLMVGDDFTNDIEGAQIFGIDQYFYNPHHLPCDGGPTYMGDDLRDLLA